MMFHLAFDNVFLCGVIYHIYICLLYRIKKTKMENMKKGTCNVNLLSLKVSILLGLY